MRIMREKKNVHDIQIEVTVSASPETVYRSLTDALELEAWWAKRVVAEPKVGSVLEATFHVGSDHEWVIEMEVSNLEPAYKVEWTPRRGASGWVGTHITWGIIRTDAGTKIRFVQRGFSPSTVLPNGTFPGHDGWEYYMASLKDYLETGEGRPGGFRVRR